MMPCATVQTHPSFKVSKYPGVKVEDEVHAIAIARYIYLQVSPLMHNENER
eukprot:m.571400 g.571400  ORF g.571400 m.571400 type:complete len:51 (+) comp22266_c0_seq17:2239-2391(+)